MTCCGAVQGSERAVAPLGHGAALVAALPTGRLAHERGGDGDFLEAGFGHAARDQLDEAKAFTSREASDVHIVNFLYVAGDHDTSSAARFLTKSLTITTSRKKRHEKNPLRPENFNYLRASSRYAMKFAAHSIRETGKENEATMFRDGLGIGRWRRG